MTDHPGTTLIHGEIDGELDEHQRAELARWLLSDPPTRLLRDELRQVCSRLETLEVADPPPDLKQRILGALPQPAAAASQHWRGAPRWRLAAAIAAVLVGTAVLYEVSTSQLNPSDAAGTIAAKSQVLLSNTRVDRGPLSGWLKLYGDRGGLSLQYQLVSTAGRVDLVVAAGGQTLRFNDVGGPGTRGAPREAIRLPAFVPGTQAVQVQFLIDGRAAGSANLPLPGSR